MSDRFPEFVVELGVDPTNDWRAPYVYWSPNHPMAAAHDREGLREIFWALVSGEISAEEAREAYAAHGSERGLRPRRAVL